MKISKKLKTRNTLNSELQEELDQLNDRLTFSQNQKDEIQKKYFESEHKMVYYKSSCENILFIINKLVDKKVSMERFLPLVYALPSDLLQESGIQSE